MAYASINQMKMDHRGKRKRRSRNSYKNLYVSEKRVPVTTSTGDGQLTMKHASVSDSNPDQVTTPSCSENWRELSKVLFSFVDKMSVLLTVDHERLVNSDSAFA